MKRRTKKLKRSDDRNVSLETQVINGQKVYAGDSLETVGCPNSVVKRMEYNIRKTARASQIVFPFRKRTAREFLEDFKIPFIRPSIKRRKRIAKALMAARLANASTV
jgi:hypothetical protein